jgi:hypothetical protein
MLDNGPLIVWSAACSAALDTSGKGHYIPITQCRYMIARMVSLCVTNSDLESLNVVGFPF